MPRRFWTTEETEYLRTAYPERPTEEVAKKLNSTVSRVYSKANSLGLKKSKAFFDAGYGGRLSPNNCSRGKGTRFKPGHKSWNKGKSFTAGGRAPETQFKDGHLPHNHVPVGTEVTDPDGYLKVKIAERNRWKYKHRLVWEEKKGKIPKGHALVFRNGDKTDCSIENLELLTRAELMRRNTIHRYPEDIRKTYRAIAVLTRRINSAEKQDDRS
ncbi:MAG TPA: HNH endonuclease signature motif containing protein [Aridibacter sp.]|nr:HNH endonuclease signature motif containing protein [Aridibacter sp.]